MPPFNARALSSPFPQRRMPLDRGLFIPCLCPQLVLDRAKGANDYQIGCEGEESGCGGGSKVCRYFGSIVGAGGIRGNHRTAQSKYRVSM